MTLTDAKVLLERSRIPYQAARYESEADYWHHLTPFPYTDNARKCQVTALVIPAVNGAKDIELQFNLTRGKYLFRELWFGGYCFEMSDTLEEFLEGDILEIIGQIVDGKLAVIQCNDRKRRRWVSDCCYDLTDSDEVFGAHGFREVVRTIEAPKSFWQKLTGQKLQYDIYDWCTHRQIVK